MLENRSLDNVLGWLYEDTGNVPSSNIPAPPEGQTPTFAGLSEAEPFTNPLTWSSGSKHDVFPMTKVQPGQGQQIPTVDPHEVFAHVTTQIFGSGDSSQPATMQGFLQDFYDWPTSGFWSWDKTLQIMQAFTPETLPVLNGLARQYSVSDQWFASVPSQTNTNRAFSLCGTAQGWVDNQNFTPFTAPTIFNVLHDAGLDDWGIFYHDKWISGNGSHLPLTIPYTQFQFKGVDDIPNIGNHIFPFETFLAQAKLGSLPRFSYLEPAWYLSILGNGNSYHPPADVGPGEEMLSSVYSALTSNPEAWAKTLLIVTFDEHGGTPDHVGPGKATRPDDSVGPSGFTFDRFGVRVPTILASPWIDAGTVFRSNTDNPYDHTSVLATLLCWFGLDPTTGMLGARTAVAPTFEDVLSRSSPRTDVPPLTPLSSGAEPAVLDSSLSGLQSDLTPWLAQNLVQNRGGGNAAELAEDLASSQTLGELDAKVQSFASA